MSFHPTTDFTIWIAALLTLFIFSFLYKDNPIYTLAAYDHVAGLAPQEHEKAVLIHTGGTLNLLSIAPRSGWGP